MIPSAPIYLAFLSLALPQGGWGKEDPKAGLNKPLFAFRQPGCPEAEPPSAQAPAGQEGLVCNRTSL